MSSVTPLEKTDFPFTQQQSNASSFLPRGRTFCPLPTNSCYRNLKLHVYKTILPGDRYQGTFLSLSILVGECFDYLLLRYNYSVQQLYLFQAFLRYQCRVFYLFIIIYTNYWLICILYANRNVLCHAMNFFF